MAYTISTNMTDIKVKNIINNDDGYTFVVSVDGSSYNNSFTLEYEGADWFDIVRNRNVVEILVKNNYTISERSTYIACVHNCDNDIKAIVNIIQEPTKYEINANIEEITFPSLEYDEKSITISASGGSDDYYIRDVQQFVEDTIVPRRIDYDKGLIIEKKDNTQLIVKSYGRIFLENNNYYNIIIAHKDYKDVFCEVKVYYSNDDVLAQPMMLNVKEEETVVEPLIKEIRLKEDETNTEDNNTPPSSDITSFILEDNGIVGNEIKVNAGDSQIMCKTTGVWCLFNIVGNDTIEVYVSEKERNIWDIDRYCYLYVINAESPDLKLKYKITNKEERNIDIVLLPDDKKESTTE